jgi:potassium-transporting ATPase KdpC subunit
MNDLRTSIRPALVSLALFTALLSLVYPVAITGVAKLAFPHQANGSLIIDHDRVVGSELIGQPFTHPAYLWGRPSATAPFFDNAMSSAASNLAPANPDLVRAVNARIAAFRAADPENQAPIPIDLVTASASGLDPHISPGAARYQVPRIARARGASEQAIAAIIEAHVEDRQLGVLGDPRVNVLAVNRDLDASFGRPR